ncbi:hypothetical protein ABPG75_012869 [Micractinium tetrahymenae]
MLFGAFAGCHASAPPTRAIEARNGRLQPLIVIPAACLRAPRRRQQAGAAWAVAPAATRRQWQQARRGSQPAAAEQTGSAATEQPEPQQAVDQQILAIALPTLATLAADPLASLVSTWYVGLLGTQPLASAGVALSLFNSSTKLLNMPLLAVTTSSVAAALGAEQADQLGPGSTRHAALGAAVSSALAIALLVGLVQAALLAGFGASSLAVWGAGPGSSLHADAAAYLGARALAAPATVLMLVLQGCFRGLGDTQTPFYATVLANVLNVGLELLLIFVLGLGVRGAALAVGLSQAAACAVLLAMLARRCPLGLVGGESLSRTLGYLRSTGLLALRTLAIMGVYSLATSLAARTDPAHAAAHQIAFQVWLASSLLADSLAVAAQTLLARSLAAGRSESGHAIVQHTMRMALGLGLLLAVGLALGRGGIAAAFSRDPAVLGALGLVMPAVILTQPLNSLAFLMDGVLYGAGGFQYAAVAMVAACLPAAAVMLAATKLAGASGVALAPQDVQLLGVWAGLGLLMFGRFATIYLPLRQRKPPFEWL